MVWSTGLVPIRKQELKILHHLKGLSRLGGTINKQPEKVKKEFRFDIGFHDSLTWSPFLTSLT